MKAKLLSLIFITVLTLLACSVQAGSPPNWTITALNDTTRVAIMMPENTKCGSVSVYLSDGADFLISKDAAGTDERPTAPDALGEGWSDICGVSGGRVVFYARSLTGTTPNLILLYQTIDR